MLQFNQILNKNSLKCSVKRYKIFKNVLCTTITATYINKKYSTVLFAVRTLNSYFICNARTLNLLLFKYNCDQYLLCGDFFNLLFLCKASAWNNQINRELKFKWNIVRQIIVYPEQTQRSHWLIDYHFILILKEKYKSHAET